VLFGRDEERAVVGRLLDAARQARSGAIVVRGEAGVGKTALLADTRERAADMHALTSVGVESEAELPFAGLHQLVRPALHLLDRLPGPQAHALQGALGLSDRGENERFLVSAACLTLLSELAERRPVLCIVDDAQWLDTPSADALLFVARRLGAEGIVMMFGAREGDDRRFEARGVDELVLGALDAAAADELLAHGSRMAPAVREALVEQAGGIALALVELPAALTPAQLAGAEPLPETLPLTRDVERLFSARVRRLPESAQRALLIVAADGSGALGPVSRACEELGLGADALTPAEHAGLVAVHGARIELRHPLVRSAVYQGASSSQRRAVHLALADAFDGKLDLDQHAWHRAAAALGPDDDIAAALELTAERARLRSGYAAAAAALQRAAELSVDAASRARRLVAAATAAWQAGQPDRATILLDHASPDLTEPRLRAQAAHVRGEIEWRGGALLDAVTTLLDGADEVATLDPGKALDMLYDACWAGFDIGDRALSAEAGRRASLLPRTGDRIEALRADLLAGVSRVALGDLAEIELVRQTLARVDELDDARSLVMAGVGFTTFGDDAMRSAVLRRADALARASGAVGVLSTVLVNVTITSILNGQYAVAAGAQEGLELAREAGLENAATLHLSVLSWLAAVHGHEEECRAKAAEAIDATRTNGLALAHSIAQWAVALLDLGSGRAEDAMTRLAALAAAPMGVGHPYFVLNSSADLVEACVRTGRREDARPAYELLDGFARPEATVWALALSARCRALLADGDDDADVAFTEALELHSRNTRSFDRARTELLFGEHLRRRRRRVEAREHLRAALEAFDALGAVAWAERARTELRASGESARKRDPSTVTELTPQELQVARFVAEGLSNKEVAAQLFLSPRTIDAHLRNVFAKLGITSRTQLAHLTLGLDEPMSDAAPAVA
jgi:DNA-binding CsgD family transcriptional regulator